MKKEQEIELICDALLDRKGYNIKRLDVSGLSPVSDVFIIASGSNRNQLEAMCDAVEEKCRDNEIYLKEREGRAEGGWILLDYDNIVVHIFSSEMREFYDLDHVWRGAAVI